MDADNARVTLFTSGSTGAPKRIIKTVRQLELEAEIVDRVLGRPFPRMPGFTPRSCISISMA